MQTLTLVSWLRQCDKRPVPEFVLKSAADRLEEYHNQPVRNLPCRIGDKVWAIRRYKGVRHAQQGLVNSMYYLSDMTLHITVKHVARGRWGESIFATEEECNQAIQEQNELDRLEGGTMK